nr:RNA-directed DNA polymerase, eukaryota [Tanacetum cinerariifolium]
MSFQRSGEDHVIHISKSIFVTNFPEDCGSHDLWRVCEGYGKVVDVYILNRRSRLGNPASNVQGNMGSYATAVRGIVPLTVPCVHVLSIVAVEGFPKVKLSYLGGFWVMIELENEVSKSSLLDHVGVKSWYHIMQEATQDFVSEERVAFLVTPPVFTPDVSEFLKDKGGEDDTISNDVEKEKTPPVHANVMNTNIEVTKWFIGESTSIHTGPVHNGGSIFDVLEDMVRVGYSMGYNLEGCLKDIESINGAQGVKEVSHMDVKFLWGNSNYQFISSDSNGNSGELIVMGDSNDVQCKEERLDSLFNPLGARLFNQFINSSGLVEVKLEGYSFTWSHPSASKMSKLDRFLVTEGMHLVFPSMMVICLDRHLSDHRPILLHEALKPIIRCWVKDKKSQQFGAKNNIVRELGDIDKILDHDNISDTVLLKRMELMHPVKVKDTFKDHVQTRFEQPSPNRFKPSSPFTKRLSPDQVVDMDSNVSRNEIRRAVWDCGDNKSSVYAPQQLSMKRSLWDYISTLLRRWNGDSIVMGDFNDVRCKEERLGSLFNPLGARLFNQFNNSSGLVEVKLEGYSFTWSHPSASKMSKLDRFLVTEGMLSVFPSMTAICLDRHLSDHRPILLHEALKPIIRCWVKEKKSQQFGAKNDIVRELGDIDKILDHGNVSDAVLLKRMELMHPVKVKDTFKDHFQARFEQPSPNRFKLSSPFTKRLSPDQVVDMDSNVSRNKIRRAVWDCDFCCPVEHFFEHGSFSKGCNSSFIALIPKVSNAKFVSDFRPISLIGCVYKVVTKILANRLASVISDIVSDTQSAFVAKRNILDGPFILNELLSWCKKSKKQAMFFKVDFAKAYDSVRWDYLLDILHAFGFGPKWCRWIRGIFSFAKALVLVNGSPTSEFSFWRGLKQGDPLSPFLLILIMESLHISFSRASSDGFFKGIQIKGSITISHLFYADDAMFIGEWSDSNLKNVVKILNCFYYASGLKINIDKSQLLGVGVPRSTVAQTAGEIGCMVLNHQFRYLGVMVGELMSRRSAWDDAVNKIRSRLSNWKVKTLSIGGRLTLLKSVLGASPLYYMSIFKTPKGVLKEIEAIRSKFFNGTDTSERKITWIACPKALASKIHGGSGIFSFYALNRALVWSKVIQAIYAKGFDFISHCKKRVGDDLSTLFWLDIWVSELPLSERFPRLFMLELEKESVFLSSSGDRWICDLSRDGEYRVKEVRNFIGDLFLPMNNNGYLNEKTAGKTIGEFLGGFVDFPK